LVWTPNSKNIGDHSVVVAAKVDDLLDEVSIDLNVKATKMELDFKITSMDVDRQGKYAIAWGPKLTQENRNRHSGSAGPDEVAVIDLESQTVIVQKPLAAGVSSALIQYPHALLVPRAGNVLFRLNAKTFGDSKRLFLKNNSRRLLHYMNKQIAVVSQDHNMTLNLVDPETMKSTGTMNLGFNPHDQYGRRLLTEEGPGLIQFKSNLHNMDGTIALLETNPGFKSLVSGNAGQSKPVNWTTPYKLQDYPHKKFGRYVANNAIVGASGSVILQVRDRSLLPSPHHWVAFTIRKEAKNGNRGRKVSSYLETLSLVDGAVLDSRVFDVVTGNQSNSNFQNNGYNVRKFFPFKEKLVYARDNELFVIPLEQSVLESAPKPLHFPIVQIPILDVDKPQTISFKAVGGKGSLNYQLLAEYEGIKVDPDSGTVELDTPLMWKNHLKKGNSNIRNSRSPRGKARTVTAKQFEEWFGEPLGENKLSFVVPIQMAVTDEESQEDRISVYAVIRADRGEVDKVKAKQRAQLELARKANQVQRMAAMAAQQLARTAKKAQDSVKKEGQESRMDGIEKRMRRMEATLDAILGKIEKLEGAK